MTGVLALTLLAAGLFFMLVAAIGFARLPDLFCRLHVTGILDTLAAPLTLLAVAIWAGPTLIAFKLMLAVVFQFAFGSLVGHLLARAAVEAGLAPDRTLELRPPPEDDAGEEKTP